MPFLLYCVAFVVISSTIATEVIGVSKYFRDLIQLPIIIIIFLGGLEAPALRDLWLKILFGRTMTTLRDPIVTKEDPAAIQRSRI